MVVESQTQPREKQARTKTGDQGPLVWLGHDPVVQLREWATDTVYRLPGPDVDTCVIGSGPQATVRLVDPGRCVSRQHALLVRENRWWKIEDLRSKNGLLQDRSRSDKFPLVPGMEVGIGGLTLIAENQSLVGLRGYLARVLGWDAKSQTAIDLALRTIRAAATHRSPLLITGSDDLVAVARQIHRRTRLLKAPFVVCGSLPRETDIHERVTAIHPDPVTALELAAGGTICICADEWRDGVDRLQEAARDSSVWVQLIICAYKTSRRLKAVTTAPAIDVPALAHRTPDDVQRIVFEYAVDGMHELSATLSSFTEANRE
jgi:Inner membrane component of T3SS, cytoplasmic domain